MPDARASTNPQGGAPQGGAAALAREVARRRTFAIISHPDAGKTTLTEKLLLYSGAIREAGSVTAKTGTAQATSDWMSIERERGISISSAAMQVDYRGVRLNLLDTPGHQDFSEDTYRTLTAADSAVMLLDAARGVQEQTLKLFTVSRQRGIPIFTFINKLDRPAQDPYALLDEVETTLGIQAVPVTWPIGDGPDFKGVYERTSNRLHAYERTDRNARRAPVTTAAPDAPEVAALIGEAAQRKLIDDIELLDSALPPLDRGRFLAGEITPVFFGSVLTNFGVEVFLDHFLDLAPPPGPLATTAGTVAPTDPDFAAFVFKVQANMNPRHRDRTAFVRVASGVFHRGVQAVLTRTGREVKLSQAHALFADERATVDAAYPGDIIGLVNPGTFRIGDVISARPGVHLPSFPRFAPERFATVRTKHADKHKAFRKGIEQLAEEGVVQLFYPAQGARDPILGAVGQLQFEVFEHRMKEEYGVEVLFDHQPYRVIRWLSATPAKPVRFGMLVHDQDDKAVALFRFDGEIKYFRDEHPDVSLADSPGAVEVVRL
ncbi:MAG: peptide chain release factor 3 [Trueperaceae bacterium]|nr:peptide chain release factor 3 [Trueperaceae bacterium]